MSSKLPIAKEDESESTSVSWIPLLVVCATLFIVTIDSTMMVVAISAIVDDLKTTIGAVQAGIAVYSLVMAAFMTAGGKLGTIYGTKRVFSIGLVIYIIGTLTAAFASNVGMLILGWSVIEGLAAAALVPIAMSLIIVNYTGKQRAVAFGVFAGVAATAAALGPIVGGFLTTQLSWRYGFAGEAVVAVGVLLLMRYLVGSPANREEKLDLVGVLLAAIGFGAIVLGALLAGGYGWWNARRPFELGGVEMNPFGLSPTPFLLLAGVVVLVGLAHWLNGREKRRETPLFRLGLLRYRNFTIGFTTMAMMTAVLGGAFFVMPLFLQQALSYNALETGIALLPFSMSLLLVSLTTPRLGEKISPKYLIQAGVVLVGAGIWAYYGVAALGIGNWDMLVPFLLMGSGMGLFLAQINNVTLSVIPEEESSEGSGLANTINELGRSLGVAILGSAFTAAVFFGIISTSTTIVGSDLTHEQMDQMSIELEDASARFSDPDAFEENVLATVPDEVATRFGEIQGDAIVRALKSNMQIIFGLLVILLLVTTFFERTKPSMEQRPGLARSVDPEKPVPM